MLKVTIFSELMFAFWIFFYKTEYIRTQNYFDRSTMTKIVCAYLLWIFFWFINFKNTLVIFTILLFLPLIFIDFLPIILRKANKRQFLRSLYQFTDETLIKMKVGLSFRSALQSASQNLPKVDKIKLEKLIERLSMDEKVAFEHDQDPEVESLVSFFKELELEPHLILKRLEHFRLKQKIENKFTLKVQTALQHMKAQSIILTIIYIGLLFVVIKKFGWSKNSQVVMLSIILFSIGVIWAQKLGQSFKWKV